MSKKSALFVGTFGAAAIAGYGLLISSMINGYETEYSDADEFSGELLRELSEQAGEVQIETSVVDEDLLRLTTLCSSLSASLEQDLLDMGLDVNPEVSFDERFSDCDIKVEGLRRFDLNPSEINDDGTISPLGARQDYEPAKYIQTLLENKPLVADFCQNFNDVVVPALRQAGVETSIETSLFQGFWEDGCEINVNDVFITVIDPADIAPDGTISEHSIRYMAGEILENITEDERETVYEVLPQLLP